MRADGGGGGGGGGRGPLMRYREVPADLRRSRSLELDPRVLTDDDGGEGGSGLVSTC